MKKLTLLVMTLFVFGLQAQTLLCEIESYQTDDVEFSVLGDTQTIIISQSQILTDFEQRYCNDERFSHSQRVQLFGINKDGSRSDLSRCEISHGSLDASKDSIVISFENDHDGAQEYIQLVRKDDLYVGTMVSEWNTREVVSLVCKQLY